MNEVKFLSACATECIFQTYATICYDYGLLFSGGRIRSVADFMATFSIIVSVITQFGKKSVYFYRLLNSTLKMWKT